MSKLTGEEIIEKLKDSKEYGIGDFAYEGYVPEELQSELGDTKEVFSKGGEGQGEDWQRVYLFKNHDVYIKVKGWYASHHGTDFDGWDSLSVVVPKEKTITVYE